MWKMPAKKRNQTTIISAESAGLTFGLSSHALEDVQAKKKHPYYYAAIILITEMWQNISGENLRLLKS